MRERFNNMFALARHMLVLATRAWVCEAFSLQTIFKTNCENSEIYFLPYFSTHSPCACDNFSHTFPSRALFFGRKAFWSSLNFGRSREYLSASTSITNFRSELSNFCGCDTSEAAICLSRPELSSIKSCFSQDSHDLLLQSDSKSSRQPRPLESTATKILIDFSRRCEPLAVFFSCQLGDEFQESRGSIKHKQQKTLKNRKFGQTRGVDSSYKQPSRYF